MPPTRLPSPEFAQRRRIMLESKFPVRRARLRRTSNESPTIDPRDLARRLHLSAVRQSMM